MYASQLGIFFGTCYLIGTDKEMEKASGPAAFFGGPPESVKVIEAGATAAAKYWAAGLGATALLLWARLGKWYDTQPPNAKLVALAGAALFSAAVAIAISHLLASDVRGRAAAAVATVEARARIATRMIEAAQEVYEPPSATSGVQIIPLPAALKARNLSEQASNEKGWLAIALESHADGKRKYILVKGQAEQTVEQAKVAFDT